jgi:hypothetical protein
MQLHVKHVPFMLADPSAAAPSASAHAPLTSVWGLSPSGMAQPTSLVSWPSIWTLLRCLRSLVLDMLAKGGVMVLESAKQEG